MSFYAIECVIAYTARIAALSRCCTSRGPRVPRYMECGQRTSRARYAECGGAAPFTLVEQRWPVHFKTPADGTDRFRCHGDPLFASTQAWSVGLRGALNPIRR